MYNEIKYINSSNSKQSINISEDFLNSETNKSFIEGNNEDISYRLYDDKTATITGLINKEIIILDLQPRIENNGVIYNVVEIADSVFENNKKTGIINFVSINIIYVQ